MLLAGASDLSTTAFTVIGGGIVAVIVAIIQTRGRKRTVESTSGQATAIVALAEEIELLRNVDRAKDTRIVQLEAALAKAGVPIPKARKRRRRAAVHEEPGDEEGGGGG